MKKTSLIVIAIIFIVVVYKHVGGNVEVVNLTSSSPSLPGAPTDNQTLPQRQIAGVLGEVPFQPSSYTCKSVTQQVSQLRRDFAQSIDVEDYLEQGFSVDDVTMLLDDTNSNKARRWRNELRKSGAMLTEFNQSINQLAREVSPDLPDYMSFMRAVPLSELEEAVAINASLNDIDKDELAPDDVAWMIANDNVSDALIKQAVNLLNDPNGIISSSYSRQKNVFNLLDSAAVNGRGKLALWMIQKGIKPNEDAYLGSSLDAALKGLGRFDLSLLQDNTPPALQAQIELIQTLTNQGYKLRGSISQPEEQDVLSSHFGSAYPYFFTIEEINVYRTFHGIDLLAIPRLAKLQSARSEQLIAMHNTKRDKFVAAQLGEGYRIRQESCVEFLTRVKEKWSPDIVYNLERDIRPDSELFQQAPELVTCRRENLYRRYLYSWQGSDIDEDHISQLIYAEQYSEAIALMADYPVFAESIFYGYIAHKPALYPVFINAGIAPAELTYSKHFPLNFAELAAQGLDLHRIDKYGRSLLYVAVVHNSAEQLEYLAEQGVPYYKKPDMPDPLYLVLYQAATRNKYRGFMPMLEAIMSYQPEIDTEHVSQLQVLELRSPDIYNQVIEKFPQLAVAEQEVAYPQATCSLY
mgnify:CR=1 FL=1